MASEGYGDKAVKMMFPEVNFHPNGTSHKKALR